MATISSHSTAPSRTGGLGAGRPTSVPRATRRPRAGAGARHGRDARGVALGVAHRAGVGDDGTQLGLVPEDADLGRQRAEVVGPRHHQLVHRSRWPGRPPRPARSTAAPMPKRSSRCRRSCGQPPAAGAHDHPAGHAAAGDATPPPPSPSARLRKRASCSRGSRNTAGGMRRASGSAATPCRRARSRSGSPHGDVPGAAATRQRAVGDPHVEAAHPGTRCRWPPRGSRSTAWGRARRRPAPSRGGRA